MNYQSGPRRRKTKKQIGGGSAPTINRPPLRGLSPDLPSHLNQVRLAGRLTDVDNDKRFNVGIDSRTRISPRRVLRDFVKGVHVSGAPERPLIRVLAVRSVQRTFAAPDHPALQDPSPIYPPF